MKPKKCKICGTEFIPKQPLQQVCGMKCAIALGNKNLAKAEEDRQRYIKKVFSKARQELKESAKGYWIQQAQKIFNSYIRKRDENKGCISCGQNLSKTKFDAGHYIPAGSSSFLRFHEDNVWGQCVHDNQHRHGAMLDYREGLIKRIGIERVEWLEANRHNECKRSINDLKEIIEIYKIKIKQL